MRRCLLVLLLLSVATPVAAQVAFVTAVSAKDAIGASATLTIGSIDCSGANTACHVTFIWRQDLGQTFVGFAHSGSSFTNLTTTTCQGGFCMVTAYICNGGGTGNLTAQISLLGNTTFGGVTKLSGVDCAGTPVGTTTLSTSSGGAGTSVTTNVTTAANGMAVDGTYIRDSVAATPNGGQTQRYTQTDAGSVGLWGSTKPHTATSLGWSWTGSLDYIQSVTPFNASGGGAAAVVRGPLVGVLP